MIMNDIISFQVVIEDEKKVEEVEGSCRGIKEEL